MSLPMLDLSELHMHADTTSMSMAGGSLAHLGQGSHVEAVTAQPSVGREQEAGISL
jgi:hypothetical protein